MWSAAFSPAMIDGALRLPLVTRGKIELSATRKASTPMTRQSGSTTAQRVVGAAEAGGAAGVVGALGVLADEGVELVVGLHVGAGLDLVAGVGAEGGLAEDLAGQADAVAEVGPVLLGRHVVEADRRRDGRVGGLQADGAARGRAHRADMGLEAVALDRGAAVVADGERQEMVLDVGVVDAGGGADEGGGFELVRGAEAGLGQQPLRRRCGPCRDSCSGCRG